MSDTRTFEVWPEGEADDEWCDKRLIEAGDPGEAAELYWKKKCADDPDYYNGGRVHVRYFGGKTIHVFEIEVDYDPVFNAREVKDE